MSVHKYACTCIFLCWHTEDKQFWKNKNSEILTLCVHKRFSSIPCDNALATPQRNSGGYKMLCNDPFRKTFTVIRCTASFHFSNVYPKQRIWQCQISKQWLSRKLKVYQQRSSYRKHKFSRIHIFHRKTLMILMRTTQAFKWHSPPTVPALPLATRNLRDLRSQRLLVPTAASMANWEEPVAFWRRVWAALPQAMSPLKKYTAIWNAKWRNPQICTICGITVFIAGTTARKGRSHSWSPQVWFCISWWYKNICG